MSRETPGVHDHVQDRIAAHGADVWELMQQGGYIYVCGSQAMRHDVRRAFINVAITRGGLAPADAEAYMVRLERNEGRYRPDVWG
jgi:sulfite reductase alpha subunit-like flavoprotein